MEPIRWSRIALVLAVLTLVICGGGEVVLRLRGATPWQPQEGVIGRVAQEVEPGGTLFRKDPRLGYGLIPGAFTVRQRTVTFHPTHDAEGHRISRPLGTPAPNGPEVWILGDSFTYGWVVEDTETFAWQLQLRLPGFRVTNFAVGGYSTVQSLIQLEAGLAEGRRPMFVVVAYASLHDGRNAFLRANHKTWAPFASKFPLFPRGVLRGGDLAIELARVEYHAWPLERRSALVNTVADLWNKLQVVLQRPEGVTQAVLLRMRDRCREAGAELVILGVHPSGRTRDMLVWARASGIRALDVSVEPTPENIVVGDGHPNARSHARIADALARLLMTN